MLAFRRGTGLALFSLLLASCTGKPEVGPAVRITIEPSARLFAKAGETAQLRAQAYDATGEPVAASITWRSSRPETIAVDPTGLLTARVDNGSTQIVAEGGGVAAVPVLAVVTPLPPGSILLKDAQILGDPVASDPTAKPSVANTYRVVLSGVPAPAVGALVVNTESKPVAGRVVSASPEGDRTTVTLKLVPGRELFPQLKLSETFDLTKAELVLNPALAATYDIARHGNTLTLTPKDASARSSTGEGKRQALTSNEIALGPFTCEPSLTGLNRLPILLSNPPVLSLTQSFAFDVVFTAERGLERLALHGGVGASYDGSVTVSLAFEGALPCELEIGAIRIPIGGPLSLLVGGLIPLKIGFEIGGRLTIASVSVGAKAQASAEAELGIACAGGGPCQLVRSLTGTAEAKPVFTLPSLGDLRYEPQFSVFGKAELAIGNPLLRALRFAAVEAQMGPKLEGSFAPWRAQIEATDYASTYGLAFESRVGVGSDLGGALELLGLDRIDAVELRGSVALASSPVGTVSANVTSFASGDTVDVTVNLDPAKVNFFPVLGPYNVKEIVLVKRVASGEPRTLARVPASSGQSVFRVSFRATESGQITELYAFVTTTILPLDLFALEVGQATRPSPYQVNVQMPAQIAATTSAPVTITVTKRTAQGAQEPASGLLVELSVTCGSVTPTSATTSAQGTVTATITASAGCTSVSLEVVVRESAGAAPVAEQHVSANVTPPPQKTLPEIIAGSYKVDVICGFKYGTGTATATANGQVISVTWSVTLSDPGQGSGGYCGDAYRNGTLPTSGSFSGTPVKNALGQIQVPITAWQASPCVVPPSTHPDVLWLSPFAIPVGSCAAGPIAGSLRYWATKIVPP